MTICFEKWESKFNRPCFMESKVKKIRDTIIKKYKEECNNKGAILFCVARANFTEG